MLRFLLICFGSAVGGGARYLLSGWALQAFGTTFPYGTLVVNVVGSFLIGIIMHVGLTTALISPTVRIILTTGVLGGFTTSSRFNYETMQYFQAGELFKGPVNIAVMVCSCVCPGYVGLLLARRLAGS